MQVRLAWILGMAWLGICPASAAWFVEVESGVAVAGYNDVRIPPGGGTRFSLVDDLEADPTPYLRLRAGTRLGERHTLLALAAPLRIDSQGNLTRPVSYHGTDFAAGIPIDALYRFDSYRLTYRYRVWATSRVRLELGLTAKIRDAEIRLAGGGAATSKTDTGFVPLLAFAFDWRWSDRVGLTIEGDAAASPGGEGRAEDLFAGVRYTAPRGVDLLLGYRLLEGGADVETVYNFAMVHYATVGLRANL